MGSSTRVSRVIHYIVYSNTHVLPTIEMTELSYLSIDYTVQRISCSLAEDESLNMSRLDFASMVDHIASGSNDDLGHVEGIPINFRVPQRNVDLILASCLADAVHFFRFRTKTVLVVCLEKW